MAQKTTKNDTINALQQQVIELLMSGESISETCRKVGIDRSTFYQWSKDDPVFIAEMNRAKSEMHGKYRDRIARMTDAALVAVEDALQDFEDKQIRLKAAFAVLKAGGLLEPSGASIGALDPEDAAREIRNQQLINMF